MLPGRSSQHACRCAQHSWPNTTAFFFFCDRETACSLCHELTAALTIMALTDAWTRKVKLGWLRLKSCEASGNIPLLVSGHGSHDLSMTQLNSLPTDWLACMYGVQS